MLDKRPAALFWSVLRHPSLWAAVGYLVLSLLLLAPTLPVFDKAILGGPIAQTDGWQNVWNLWWTGRALAEGQNPFVTTMLYYPTGVLLYLQTLNVTNGIIGALFTWLGGPIAAYNFCLIVAFALSGWGTYLLARRLTGSASAAFLAGVLFSFSPFHLTKLTDGQLELVSLQWIPLFLLFLLRAVEEHRRSDVIVAAVFFVLVALTSWYYALFCLVYSGLFVLLWMVTTRQRWRQVLGYGLASLGLAALLLLPVLLPPLIQEPVPTYISAGFYDLLVMHSADLLDFILPSPLHPLWGDWAYRIGAQLHPLIGTAGTPLVAGWNVAFGYVALALAMLGLASAWRQGWRWGLLLLGMVVLAWGPALQVAGRNTGIPLPYALLLNLPGLGMARRPSHFAALATLLLALLAAYGLCSLLGWLRPRWRPFSFLLILLLIGFEYLPRPLPSLCPQGDPYYATLGGGQGALLELPERPESSSSLQAQMVHGRPITGGFVSRIPPYPFVKTAPGVRELWTMRPSAPDIIETGRTVGLLSLRAFRFSYVVLHWGQLTLDQREGMKVVLQELLGDAAPAFQDAEVSFYEVPQVPLRPFAFLGEDWGKLEQTQDRRWRWIGESATIYLENPFTWTVGITLQVTWQSFLQERPVDLYLDRQHVGQVQVPLALSEQSLALELPPGLHALSLRTTTDVEPSPPNRHLSITFTKIAVLSSSRR